MRRCEQKMAQEIYEELWQSLKEQEEIAKAKKLESVGDEKLLDAVFYTTKVNVVGEVMQIIRLLAKDKGVSL